MSKASCSYDNSCMESFFASLKKEYFYRREYATIDEVKKDLFYYKKLWKLLIDKYMKKKDLQAQAGISWTSVTKLSKGENVSMEVLMKVCKALECNIGDIMDLIPEDKDEM